MYVYWHFYCSPTNKNGSDSPTFSGLATPLSTCMTKFSSLTKVLYFNALLRIVCSYTFVSAIWWLK